MRECCRKIQAEVVSNSRNKIHQTWGPLFSPPLYRLDCPAALERIREQRPISIKDDKGNKSKTIAETVALFITIMDKLRLGIKSMDELYADIKDLSDSLDRLSDLPPDFEGKARVAKWLTTLSGMGAAEELDDAQVRQMTFDLENVYSEFQKTLHDT